MTEKTIEKQELCIKDRSMLTLDGVLNVEGFSDDYLNIETRCGKVIVEGSNLKIESLTKEDGVITVSGSISGVFYKTDKVKSGIFSRMFG